MAVAVSNLERSKSNNNFIIRGTLTFDSSYPTGGESLSADLLGLAYLTDFEIKDEESGYMFERTITSGGSSVTLKVYNGGVSSFTPAGTNSTSAVTGTAAAQTFTPSATSGDLNLGAPAFSGTGLTAAGQVITTTSTHTMTLNQCAGMWLIPATGATPPMLILSNTAVTSAPAVLTVQGSASTDAGAYKIVRVNTAGTNADSASLTATAAAQTFTGTAVAGAVATEVANATNLSSLVVNFEAVGK